MSTLLWSLFAVGFLVFGAMFTIGVLGSAFMFWADLFSKFY